MRHQRIKWGAAGVGSWERSHPTKQVEEHELHSRLKPSSKRLGSLPKEKIFGFVSGVVIDRKNTKSNIAKVTNLNPYPPTVATISTGLLGIVKTFLNTTRGMEITNIPHLKVMNNCKEQITEGDF